MPEQNYNWKRFWYPREQGLNLADGGYLPDPESEDAYFYNQGVLSFEAVRDKHSCLVLLGEPGIGKSRAIKQEKEAIQVSAQAEGNEVLFCDLRSYKTDTLLVHELFECPEFLRWKAGSHILYMYLDSLDECLLRVDSVAALLADKLDCYDVARLRLHIACRMADWPSILEAKMRELWG